MTKVVDKRFPRVTQLVSIFPIEVFWVPFDLQGFMNKAGKLKSGEGKDFCLVKYDKVLGIEGMFIQS